jgi:pimeloyl-ACP methyl ester carboxylesterase
VPEVALRAHDFHMVRSFIEPDGIPGDEIDRCVDALRPPGAVEAAIAYYRAEVRDSLAGTAPKSAVISMPVMVVWGMKDRFLVPSLSQPPAEWVPNVEVVRLENATHWTPVDSAAEVAQSFERFFT